MNVDMTSLPSPPPGPPAALGSGSTSHRLGVLRHGERAAQPRAVQLFTILSVAPPVVGFSVGPSPTPEKIIKDTLAVIRSTNEFVVNIASPDLARPGGALQPGLPRGCR